MPTNAEPDSVTGTQAFPPEPLITLSPLSDSPDEDDAALTEVARSPVASPGAEPAVVPEVPVPAPRSEEPAPVPTVVPEQRPRPGREDIRPTPRPPERYRYTLVSVVSALRALSLTFAAAVIVSTIFMWFTSPEFLSAGAQNALGKVQATAARSEVTPTYVPTPVWFKRVGVVAGHSGIATYGPTRGNTDPGNVCPDGFTEESVTMRVAQQVVAELQGRGYTADLLEEFDPRLDNYQAAAFISIHAEACTNFDDGFNHTGFKVVYPVDRLTVRDQDLRLNDCMRDNYGAATGLPFTPAGITENMTNYHSFHLYSNHPGIASTTPAVIIELGLLGYDRDLLQNHPDKAARGVINGLLCFLDPLHQQVQPTLVPATNAPLLPGTPIGPSGAAASTQSTSVVP